MPDKVFRYLGTGVAVVALLSLISLFGPAQLGGPVTYVTTHGDSMEPKIHEGDLALIRPTDTYEQGDVIAYRSEKLDRIVLHRIIRMDGNHFVTQGDNNDWVDSDRPSSNDIIGRLWLRGPGLGGVAESLRAPKAAALVAGLLAAWMVVSGNGKRRARNRREAGAGRSVVSTEQMLTYVLAIGGAFALLAGFAFARPTQASEEDKTTYTHQGEFSYSADVTRGAAYSDGRITTGEPVFLRLADSIDVTFDYELRSDLPLEVAGEAALVARLGDPGGWNRTFRLTHSHDFNGSNVRLEGHLDLKRIRSLIQDVERETALPKDIYPLAIVPQVEVRGTMGEHEIAGEFSPRLDMQLDALQLQQVPVGSYAPGAGPSGDPINPTLEGAVTTTSPVDGYTSLLGLDLRIASLRLVALVGFLLSTLVGAALWITARSSGDASSHIALRYRNMLVPVAPSALDAYDRVVEVTDLDSLGAIARQRERMVLTFEREGVYSFFIDEGGVAYVARVPQTEVVLRPVAVPHSR